MTPNAERNAEEKTAESDLARERSIVEMVSLGVVSTEVVKRSLQHAFIIASEAYRDRNILNWYRASRVVLGFAKLGQAELRRVSAERARNPGSDGALPPPDMAIVNELRLQLLYGDHSLDKLYEAALREDAGILCPDRGDHAPRDQARWPDRKWNRTTKDNLPPNDPDENNVRRSDTAHLDPFNHWTSDGNDAQRGDHAPRDQAHRPQGASKRAEDNQPPNDSDENDPPHWTTAHHNQSHHSASDGNNNQPSGEKPDDRHSYVRMPLIWFTIWLAGAGAIGDSRTAEFNGHQENSQTISQEKSGPAPFRRFPQEHSRNQLTDCFRMSLEVSSGHRFDTS